MKRKRIIAAIFAAVGAILIIHSCSRAGAGVSALAVSNTVTLTSAQTVALFGQTIPCEYLSTDGTYKQTTATYSSTWQVGYESFYSPDGQSFAGRDVVQYVIPYASDMQVVPADITLYFQTAVDISALTYVDTAIVQYTNLDFATQLYGTYTDYWYCSDGYHYPLRAGADGTNDANYYGCIGSSSLYKYTVLPCVFTSASNTAFSTGWAKCGSFKDTTYADFYCIGIVCPILSADWQYDGSTGAGSGFGSGGESSGGGGDSVDLSGITARLDDILDKLDSIIANQESNGSSSGSGSEPSALDSPPPTFDAAAAWSAADGAFHNPFSGSSGGGFDLGLSVPDSGSGGGSASPPVDPTPPDESDMGAGLAAVWFLISYIFGTFPWLATLTTFSLSVGVAVFIIFHGRGSE